MALFSESICSSSQVVSIMRNSFLPSHQIAPYQKAKITCGTTVGLWTWTAATWYNNGSSPTDSGTWATPHDTAGPCATLTRLEIRGTRTENPSDSPAATAIKIRFHRSCRNTYVLQNMTAPRGSFRDLD
jgi:hypothetical protein